MNRFELARLLRKMPRGHEYVVSRFVMDEVYRSTRTQFIDFGGLIGEWTPADWVMENIAGSAYEFRYWQNMDGNTVFYRLRQPLTEESNLRTYVSPDRRHLFAQRWDGLFELKQ